METITLKGHTFKVMTKTNHTMRIESGNLSLLGFINVNHPSVVVFYSGIRRKRQYAIYDMNEQRELMRAA